jgi:hypothetical protein
MYLQPLEMSLRERIFSYLHQNRPQAEARGHLPAPFHMQTVHFDEGFTWDDPNIRWGNPSYRLEPGDPGYVPPFPPQTPTKTKRMKRTTYFPTKQSEQIIWLVNFCNKLAAHATALGLTAPQAAALIKDGLWLVYVLQSWLPGGRAWVQACTEASKTAMSGVPGADMVLPVFTAPALPTGVTPVPAGALERIVTAIEVARAAGKITPEIGEDLKLIGPVMDGPNLETVQPKFPVRVTGQAVVVDWDWGGLSKFLDRIHIEVDRGDGQAFRFLTQDSTPGYNDTAPRPAAPTKWTYRAIFMVDDAHVGVWSNSVSVLVGG